MSVSYLSIYTLQNILFFFLVSTKIAKNVVDIIINHSQRNSQCNMYSNKPLILLCGNAGHRAKRKSGQLLMIICQIVNGRIVSIRNFIETKMMICSVYAGNLAGSLLHIFRHRICHCVTSCSIYCRRFTWSICCVVVMMLVIIYWWWKMVESWWLSFYLWFLEIRVKEDGGWMMVFFNGGCRSRFYSDILTL